MKFCECSNRVMLDHMARAHAERTRKKRNPAFDPHHSHESETTHFDASQLDPGNPLRTLRSERSPSSTEHPPGKFEI